MKDDQTFIQERERQAQTQQGATPQLSVVIPIHNEGRVLSGQSIPSLIQKLETLSTSYELVLCENGSTDNSLQLTTAYAKKYPTVRVEQLGTPDYGRALKHALRTCRSDLVVIFNMDLCRIDFIRAALPLLKEADIVLGSKTMPGARDKRPLFRRLITRSFNVFLRFFYGFRGTDTHGLKAFKRQLVAPILEECVTDHFIFDTELILRAQRAGLRVKEIPVHIRELRQPSYLSLIQRTPKVLWNLIKLWFTLNRIR